MFRKIGIILTFAFLVASYSWAEAHGGTVKLSPRVRTSEFDAQSILSPDLKSKISPFLKQDIVLDTLENKAYVVGTPAEHLAGVAGDTIYARGIGNLDITSYSVFRMGKPYVDPDSREVLGYSAKYIGSAELKKHGDPASLLLINSTVHIGSGDKLIPKKEVNMDLDFAPHFPEQTINAKIIAVPDSINQMGKYSTAIINKGARDGVRLGDMLTILKKGATVNDKLYADQRHPNVSLPTEVVGELMVFKVYKKLSYAIITKTSSQVEVLDLVANAPE